MDGVQTQSLGALGQVGLAFGCAVFCVYAHFQVLLGGVGDDFAQQFSKLCCVLCFFPSGLFPIQTDLRIAFAMGHASHSQIHTHFGAFAFKVGAQVSLDVFGDIGSDADDVFRSPVFRHGLFLELFAGALALGADEAFGDRISFQDITTDRTYILCHNEILHFLNQFISIFRTASAVIVDGVTSLSGNVTVIVAGQRRFVKSFFEKNEKIFYPPIWSNPLGAGLTGSRSGGQTM